MLKASGLEKTFGTQTLFDNAGFVINPGERVGVVGRNGHGKSTLFKLIIGSEEPDAGSISLSKGYRVGHLEQVIRFTAPTVVEEACLGLALEEREQTYRAERILGGLGFSAAAMKEDPSTFSGGFQLRINLAKLFLSAPNLLLLDEPTNYLDIVSVRWLAKELQDWRDELMMISHDRAFMDNVTTHTLGIHRGAVRKIEGGTKKFFFLLQQEEEIREKTRLGELKKREATEDFIRRFRATASKAALVQSRVKQLEKTEVLKELETLPTLNFSFTNAPFLGKQLLECKNVSFAYGDKAPLIKDFSFALKPGDRVGIMGKNGRGKSTLLRLLAGELTPSSGTIDIHERAARGFFGQTNVARLKVQRSIEEEIQDANTTLSRTQVRAICGTMMFSGAFAERRIEVLSGGERSRVLLGKIIATPSNVLLLDEPTSHLDIESVDALIESIQRFEGAVIVVSHSEMLLEALATTLVVFGEDGPEIFRGGYSEFLAERGWGDEDQAEPSASRQEVSKLANGSKEAAAAPVLSWEQKKLLRSLTARLDKHEKEFARLDAELRNLDARLLTLSEAGKFDEAARTGKDREALNDRVLSLLDQIETLSKEKLTLGS